MAFCTADDVLAALRLAPTDADAAVIADCVEAASALMRHAFDAPVPDGDQTPPEVHRFAITVSVRLYRVKDAPFGVLDTWSADGVGPVRLPRDPLYGIEHACASVIAAHGVG